VVDANGSGGNVTGTFPYWDVYVGNERCNCPANFAGTLCDVPKTKCGNKSCFNGGKCLLRDVHGQTIEVGASSSLACRSVR
jgi:hypothetical protein